MTYIVFLLSNLLILFSSMLLVYKYYSYHSISDKILSIAVIFFSQVSLSVLLSGIVIKNMNVITLVVINMIISGFIILMNLKHLKVSISTMKNEIKRTIIRYTRIRDFTLHIIIFLFLFQIVILLFKIYMFPPQVWDSFTYHMHPIIDWFQKGRISIISTPVTRTNSMSLGANLLDYWFVVFFKDVTWAELPQFIFGLLIALSSYSIMRKLYIKRINSLKYSIIIYFIPTILVQSRTVQDHLILTSTFLLGLNYSLAIFYKKEYKQIWLMALAFGLFLGIKLIAPLYLLLLFGSLIVLKSYDVKMLLSIVYKNKYKIIISGFIILCLGSYWYFRNIFIYKRLSGSFRNDIFNVGQLSNTSGILHEISFRIQSFCNNILNFISRITDASGSYYPDLENISGFGMQFFVFGIISYIIIPVMLLSKKSKKKGIIHYLLISTLLIHIAYFFIYYTKYNYRLFLLIPVVGIIFWAYLLSIIKFDKNKLRYLNFVLIFIIVFNMITCVFSESTTPTKFKNTLVYLNKNQRNSINYSSYLGSEWEFIDHYIPTNETIAYISDEDGFIYPYFANNLNRKIYFIGENQGSCYVDKQNKRIVLGDSLKKILSSRNIHYIHINLQDVYLDDPDFTELINNLYYYK